MAANRTQPDLYVIMMDRGYACKYELTYVKRYKRELSMPKKILTLYEDRISKIN